MKIVVLALMAALSGLSWAQGVLPKGIGAYSLGLRQYMNQKNHFDDSGSRKSLASDFERNFDGQNLLNGGGGDELKKLADQLARFDGDSSTPGSLLNTLELGSLGGKVEGKVTAYAFGVGYGFSKDLSFFGMIPYVDAQVESTIEFKNANNVAEIRARLGETAFDELKSGLNRAEQINTQMIVDSITDMGYQNPNESWSYRGVGDIELGAVFSRAIPSRSARSGYWKVKSSVTLPTGYYDDPDVLNDISVGTGYIQSKNQASVEFSFLNQVVGGGHASLNLGLPTTVEKRVSENGEALVDQSRKTSTTMTPGMETDGFIYGGVMRGIATLTYGIGVLDHFEDSFDGELEGDYAALSEGTATHKVYQSIGVSFSTVEKYKNGKFSVPFIANISLQNTLTGRNTMDDTYLEFSITSFFSTPAAEKTSEGIVSNKKKGSSRLAH